MDRPWLLDLFAGAGGAGEGYRRAGFHVVAVDIDPKPLRHNPHECYQGDALDVLDALLAGGMWQGYRLHDFAAIHASPPCQHYSVLNAVWRQDYPDLVRTVYERLMVSGLPFVVENVSAAPMPGAIVVCGSALGLRVIRHRAFWSSHLLYAPGPCRHTRGATLRGEYLTVTGATYQRGQPRNTIADRRAAMGIGWMTQGELSQAIPPAYTAWIGAQLMAVVATRGAA